MYISKQIVRSNNKRQVLLFAKGAPFDWVGGSRILTKHARNHSHDQVQKVRSSCPHCSITAVPCRIAFLVYVCIKQMYVSDSIYDQKMGTFELHIIRASAMRSQ